MTDAWPLGGLLLTFLIASATAFATRLLQERTQRAVETIHIVAIAVALLLAIMLISNALNGERLFLMGGLLFVDALGGIFLGLIVVVGFLTGLYSIGYLRHNLDKREISAARLSTYYAFFHLFLFTMTLAVTANNLVLMWVAIEATTLASVFLVGFYGRRTSLEAAWKYVVICTVGVAFGLYGTVLIFSNANALLANAEDAILWTEVVKHAGSLDPATIQLAFVFVLIGFGTKAGVFPMHTWMPDAYSEAPSPASALLTAGLANCALLIVIRLAVIATGTIGPAFPQTLFLLFGILSIGVAAPLIFVQRDLKRMLAYSSVENMGLIFLALGIGGPLGISAALLHAINHGLVKTLLFCGSGNVLMKYGTRNLDAVKGILRVAPVSGFLLMAGALALSGAPPFNMFISEFMTVVAGVKAGYVWLTLVCLLLLTVVFASFVRFIDGSVLGPAPANLSKGDLGGLTLAPLGLALALVLLMGVHVPRPVAQLVADATGLINGVAANAVGTTVSSAWRTIEVVAAPRGGAVLRCVSIREEDTTCPK